jgi:hypothetical protein
MTKPIPSNSPPDSNVAQSSQHLDRLWFIGLLGDDRRLRDVAYEYWARYLLAPQNPSHFITLSLGKPAVNIEFFNNSLRSCGGFMIRDFMNFVDRRIYGCRYNNIQRKERFPFFARAEFHSKFRSKTHGHWHLLFELSDEQASRFDRWNSDVTQQQKLYSFIYRKYDYSLDILVEKIAAADGDYTTSYVCKNLFDDAANIYTRELY